MPRQPLCGIYGNSNSKGGIAGRFELTPHWHFHVVGRAAGGQCPKTIADDLGMHVQYISILKNASTNHPKLMALTSDEEIIKTHMVDTLQKAWVYLNNKFLENLETSISG